MNYIDADAVEVRASEWMKIEVDTGAWKTAWPQSVTGGRTIPGDSDFIFRTATGELIKSDKRLYAEGRDEWRVNVRVRGVPRRWCVSHCCLLEITRRWVEFEWWRRFPVPQRLDCCEENRCVDPEGDEGFTVQRLHSCVQRENNAYSIFMEPNGNRIDSIPLFSSGIPGWIRTCKTGKPRSRSPRGGRSSTRSNARWSGGWWSASWCRGCQVFLLIPVKDRLPNTSWRGMQWTEIAVATASRRRVERTHILPERNESTIDCGFFGREGEDVLPIFCAKCRNNSTGCLGATVVRKGASESWWDLTLNDRCWAWSNAWWATERELSWCWWRLQKAIMRQVDLPRSVFMKSRNRADEKDPLMSLIPRHAANCVSRYRMMEDGRTIDQRRCGKTWKRSVVECGESVHFRPVGENRAMRGGGQMMVRGVNVGHHGRSGAAIFLAQDGVKRRIRIARMLEHERWDRVFSATCIEVPWQLRPEQGNLARFVVFVVEADQGVAFLNVMLAVPIIDWRRYVTKRGLVK